ncbi:hypothetical protein BJX99DRAFT_265404 [Aspergillus californicus]
MDRYLEKFSPIDALSQLFLTQTRYSNGVIGDDMDTCDTIANIIQTRASAGLDQPPFRFLENLQAALIERERGLSPGAVIHTDYVRLYTDNDESLTFWQGFIFCIIRAADEYNTIDRKDTLGRLIQLFLDRGADPEFQLWGYEHDPYCAGRKIERRLDVSVRFGKDICYVPLISHTFCDFMVARNGTITLSDLVDFWELPNRNAILATIEQTVSGRTVEVSVGGPPSSRNAEHKVREDSVGDESDQHVGAGPVAEKTCPDKRFNSVGFIWQFAIVLLGILLSVAAFRPWKEEK